MRRLRGKSQHTVDDSVGTTTDSSAQISELFRILLGRPGSQAELEELRQYASSANLTDAQLFWTVLGKSERISNELGDAIDTHLFRLHRHRVAAMGVLLPAASNIIDLGGAAAPLHHMVQDLEFDQLTIIDLPPENRHEEFAERRVDLGFESNGKIALYYSSITSFPLIADNSIDLAWSGQSIEHLSLSDAEKMCCEVFRVLRPGGTFCLDTPNRLITRIHADGGMIHPDHRHEFEPQELIDLLESTGFTIDSSIGIAEMPLTIRSGRFDYRDFMLGGSITANLNDAYIQFHSCHK